MERSAWRESLIGAPEERTFKLFARYPGSLERISRSACIAASLRSQTGPSHDDCQSDLIRANVAGACVCRVQAKLRFRPLTILRIMRGHSPPGVKPLVRENRTRLLIGFLLDKVSAALGAAH